MKQFTRLPFASIHWTDYSKYFYLSEWLRGRAWRIDYGWELHLSGLTAHDAMVKANKSTKKDWEKYQIVKKIWTIGQKIA